MRYSALAGGGLFLLGWFALAANTPASRDACSPTDARRCVATCAMAQTGNSDRARAEPVEQNVHDGSEPCKHPADDPRPPLHGLIAAAQESERADEPRHSGEPGVTDTPIYVPWYDGVFPPWINGFNCAREPKIQVHPFDPDSYILRQSMCTNFEGPFIYLLFGKDKVLMQDTGAGTVSIPLATTVYGIIDQWLAANNQASIQLVVTHSHAHGDHVSWDSQFIGQPNTVVVGKSAGEVAAFFGITSWPTQIVEYDLGGGRVIDVIPIPGHQSSHVALYDRVNHWLLTGDTLYPGRLYFPKADFNTYKTSIKRLVDFTADKPVSYVLGTHIEMTKTPGKDFPIGSTYHPDEHGLPLGRTHLLELHAALQAMPTPVKEIHDDFIIHPL